MQLILCCFQQELVLYSQMGDTSSTNHSFGWNNFRILFWKEAFVSVKWCHVITGN